MKHSKLPTLELIRDILPHVDLFHATEGGFFSRNQIIHKIKECRALLDIAAGSGELDRYQYRYDLVRKITRYEVLFNTSKVRGQLGNTGELNAVVPTLSISEKHI